MNTLTHLGTFESLIEKADHAVAALAVQTRALIESLDPNAIEVPRTKEKTVTYGVGPKKMSEAYAFISVHSAHVNLGFFYAPSLPDPEKLLEGTGASLRHIKLRTPDDLKRPVIADMLRAAIAERRAALGLDGQ
jgi:hypothetical protein